MNAVAVLLVSMLDYVGGDAETDTIDDCQPDHDGSDPTRH